MKAGLLHFLLSHRRQPIPSSPLLGQMTLRTRILTVGVEPTLRVTCKNCSIKQYFKPGRALRTETTFNDTRALGVGRELRTLDHLRQIGGNANRRRLEVERLSQNCAVSSPAFERTVPCLHVHLPNGFSNQMLREHVAAFQGKNSDEYTPRQMSYDLRRLRLKRFVQRVPGTIDTPLKDAWERLDRERSRIVQSRRVTPLSTVDCRLSTRRLHQKSTSPLRLPWCKRC